jgi:hypothetical protein
VHSQRALRGRGDVDAATKGPGITGSALVAFACRDSCGQRLVFPNHTIPFARPALGPPSSQSTTRVHRVGFFSDSRHCAGPLWVN